MKPKISILLVGLLWLLGDIRIASAQLMPRLTIEAGTNDAITINSTTNHAWRVGPNSGIGSGFGIHDATAGATRLKIDLNGNVGIGTTTPAAKLDVSGTVKATAFQGDGAGLSGISANGSAGGDLSGTYPNPLIANGAIGDAHISAAAAISASKILGGDLGSLRLRVGTNQTLSGGLATIAGGQNNVNSGFGGAVGGGSSNRVSASHGVISGGATNVIDTNAAFAAISGGTQARARSFGQSVHASGRFSQQGDAQASLYVLRGTTTNITETELFLDGVSQRMHVPVGANWAADVVIVARSAANNNVAYNVIVLVWNDGGVMNSTMSNPTLRGSSGNFFGATSSDVTVIHDDANDALVIKVRSPWGASLTRWVASVRTTEVIN